ncbi:MAG: hypothetical protein R3C61_16440 [Bacteroidia bacterium]
MDDTQIQKWLEEGVNLEESSLFRALGRSVHSGALHSQAPEEQLQDQLEEVGRKWYKLKTPEIKLLICNNEKIRQAAESENIMTVLTVASLIFPLIQSLATPGSIVIVSCLIARQGIRNWCENT